MAKCHVYVPMIPSRFDTSVQLWVPTINIEPAARWGEIIKMLPPTANRIPIIDLIAALKIKMENFSISDFLVALGDPTILSAAACIASRKTEGRIRMLKWDRVGSKYIPVEFQL